MEPVWQELAESATKQNLHPGVERFFKNLREETRLAWEEGKEGASEGLREAPEELLEPGGVVTAPIKPLLGALGMAFSPVRGISGAMARAPVEGQWGPAAEIGGLAAGFAPDALMGGIALARSIGAKGGPIISKALRGLRTSKVPKVTGAKVFKPSIGESETGLSQYIPEEVAKRQIPSPQVQAVGGKGEPAGAWESPARSAMQEATERQVVEAWQMLPESLKRRILNDPEKLLMQIEGVRGSTAGAQVDPGANILTQFFAPHSEAGSHPANILHELVHRAGKLSRDPQSRGTSFPLASRTLPGLQYRQMLEKELPKMYGGAGGGRSAEEIGPVMADRLLPVTDKGWQHRREAAWETVKPKSFREGYEADLQDLWPEEAKRVFKQIQSSRKRQAMKETVPHQ